ncbi:MAG: YIP1 family protein [Thermoactinomyces sp.]
MPVFKHPKQNIRPAMDETSAKVLFILISLYGMTAFLDQAMGKYLGDVVPLAGILLLSVLLGPLAGGMAWILSSAVIHGTTRLFKGTASFKETRHACAWATVPYSTKLMIITIPMILIFGEENFTTLTPRIDSSIFLLLLFFLFIIADIVLSIYYLVVYSKIIGEVHNIGAWKGFLSIVLIPVAIIILLVIALIITEGM